MQSKRSPKLVSLTRGDRTKTLGRPRWPEIGKLCITEEAAVQRENPRNLRILLSRYAAYDATGQQSHVVRKLGKNYLEGLEGTVPSAYTGSGVGPVPSTVTKQNSIQRVLSRVFKKILFPQWVIISPMLSKSVELLNKP